MLKVLRIALACAILFSLMFMDYIVKFIKQLI